MKGKIFDIPSFCSGNCPGEEAAKGSDCGPEQLYKSKQRFTDSLLEKSTDDGIHLPPPALPCHPQLVSKKFLNKITDNS